MQPSITEHKQQVAQQQAEPLLRDDQIEGRRSCCQNFGSFLKGFSIFGFCKSAFSNEPQNQEARDYQLKGFIAGSIFFGGGAIATFITLAATGHLGGGGNANSPPLGSIPRP